MESDRESCHDHRAAASLTSCAGPEMKPKTVSVDLEALRRMRREKGARESDGDVVRRIFAERNSGSYDPSEQLSELFPEFSGAGMLTEAGRARVRERKSSSPRSRRPGRAV